MGVDTPSDYSTNRSASLSGEHDILAELDKTELLDLLVALMSGDGESTDESITVSMAVNHARIRGYSFRKHGDNTVIVNDDDAIVRHIED